MSEGADMEGNESERRAFGGLWPLRHGGSDVRDRRRAVQRLRPHADQGYASAQVALGWAWFDGDGVRRDYATSFEYCLAAAEQGYPAAEGMVGSYYAMARPKHGACSLDLVQAARLNWRTAEHGNSGAQYNLASAYRSGCGADRNVVEVSVWTSPAGHCSPILNRMAEVLRDQAAAELNPDQKADADRRLSELSEGLPHPWSEPTGYWKALAQQAGDTASSSHPRQAEGKSRCQ
ncbi:MAG: tetratricopeptide repeat protein [Chromatiaceae bacterium]